MELSHFISAEHACYNVALRKNLKTFNGTTDFENKYATTLRLLMNVIQQKSYSGHPYAIITMLDLYPRIRRHLTEDVFELNEKSYAAASYIEFLNRRTHSPSPNEIQQRLDNIKQNQKLIRDSCEQFLYPLFLYLHTKGYQCVLNWTESMGNYYFTVTIYWEDPPKGTIVFNPMTQELTPPTSGL